MKTPRYIRRASLIAATAALLAGIVVAPMQAAAVTPARSFVPVASSVPQAQVAPRAFAVENIRLVGDYTWKAKGKADIRATWDLPPEHADDTLTYVVTLYRDDTGGPIVRDFSTKSRAIKLRNLKIEHTYGLEVQVKGQTVGGVRLYAALSFTVPIPPSTPTTPGSAQRQWIVSLGDSFISGEGGRWAANADELSFIDRGRASYYDSQDGRSELLHRCHRSKSALVHFGVPVPGYDVKTKNFACSGSITRSELLDADLDLIPEDAAIPSEIVWKPGIDFYEDEGRIGQAELLRRFAEDHHVKMVILSIGGNDFHFGDIVTDCVKAYALGGIRCEVDSDSTRWMAPAHIERVREDVTQAILNVVEAMTRAGRSLDSWTLVTAKYPQPIANSQNMRYANVPLVRTLEGGCPMWDSSIDWAVGRVLPTINDTVQQAGEAAVARTPGLRWTYMDASNAFEGHELCSNAASRVDDEGMLEARGRTVKWYDNDASLLAEWMMEVNVLDTIAPDGRETMQQENFHPNAYGQLALRNCYRELWNGGNIRGGICVPINRNALNAFNEPMMEFRPVGPAPGRAAD